MALQRKKRPQRIGDDKDITCPICQYDVNKYKFKQHENSVGHQSLLEMYEAGEDVDKPDEITTGKWGKVWYDCYACKGSMLQCMWGSQIEQTSDIDCKQRAM